jgi:hypothetical protein
VSPSSLMTLTRSAILCRSCVRVRIRVRVSFRVRDRVMVRVRDRVRVRLGDRVRARDRATAIHALQVLH